jgi:hypothetical protein
MDVCTIDAATKFYETGAGAGIPYSKESALDGGRCK